MHCRSWHRDCDVHMYSTHAHDAQLLLLHCTSLVAVLCPNKECILKLINICSLNSVTCTLIWLVVALAGSSGAFARHGGRT